MKKSKYTSFEELPLMLSVQDVSDVLGIGQLKSRPTSGVQFAARQWVWAYLPRFLTSSSILDFQPVPRGRHARTLHTASLMTS